ncbi:hypothetical protein N665_0012s0214 [Sinapis alba]|nr:hypothetical protein N665_0012s0214 [Sinapis alba]
MGRSVNLTAFLSFNCFIISFFLTQTQATNSQTITELTDTNRNIPVPENNPSTTGGEEEQEQEPVFVRDTGHGYGLYGRHTNNEEDNSNENDYNDQFYYRSDAFGNRNGRF